MNKLVRKTYAIKYFQGQMCAYTNIFFTYFSCESKNQFSNTLSMLFFSNTKKRPANINFEANIVLKNYENSINSTISIEYVRLGFYYFLKNVT
jgi:hypothetical protein